MKHYCIIIIPLFVHIIPAGSTLLQHMQLECVCDYYRYRTSVSCDVERAFVAFYNQKSATHSQKGLPVHWHTIQIVGSLTGLLF